MITFLTTKEEFVKLQIAKFKELYPKKRVTNKIVSLFESGYYASQSDGELFAWAIRDTYEKYGKALLRGEPIPQLIELFERFTKDYAVCPTENKFSLYVGFKNFLETTEDNYANKPYLLRYDVFFEFVTNEIQKFNTNNKNYSPYLYTRNKL